MEYGLRHMEAYEGMEITIIVLILVVMEYGLRLCLEGMVTACSLNPCCNGIWSQTTNVM